MSTTQCRLQAGWWKSRRRTGMLCPVEGEIDLSLMEMYIADGPATPPPAPLRRIAAAFWVGRGEVGMPGTEPSCESWTSTEICSTAPRGWLGGGLGAWERSVGGEGISSFCVKLEK